MAVKGMWAALKVEVELWLPLTKSCLGRPGLWGITGAVEADQEGRDPQRTCFNPRRELQH